MVVETGASNPKDIVTIGKTVPEKVGIASSFHRDIMRLLFPVASSPHTHIRTSARECQALWDMMLAWLGKGMGRHRLPPVIFKEPFRIIPSYYEDA